MIKMGSEPREKAKEFAKAILESDEYKRFLRCSGELEKNQQIQGLLKEFQEKQIELQKSFVPGTLEELKELQMKINGSAEIRNYMESQGELEDILRRTNNIISGRIGAKFALFAGGGCCG